MARILIADDHASIRRGLAQALAEASHDIEEAPNGNAAIEKLHEGSFDVVVSDLTMGGSSGLDVLKTAKTLHPSTVVILMTAFGSVPTAVEAMKSGAFDYVQKPFEVEEMEAKIGKALEMRRMQHPIDDLRHARGGIYEFNRLIGSSGDAGDAADPLFRYIVAGMRSGVLVLTRKGRLALINYEAYRIFGITPRRTDLGRPIGEVLRDHPEVVRLLNSVLEPHLLPNRAELRLRPSGKAIGYTLALVRDDAGRVVGASMFFKDLARVEQIEERERLRDRLAAAIAHEVRNPLAGIEVMAGLLHRKIADTPDAQSVLTDIINDAKIANAVVQEVLEFVRPIRLLVERTAVAEAVQAAVQLADTQARRGDISVGVKVPQGLPLIQGDQYQLTQLFTNLLINAYEAMEGRGRVTITARTVRMDDGSEGWDAVVVELTDEGPGMPHDVADRVFNPFFTTKPQASGLGLAIVRKIVDAHNGIIDLETAPGCGTLIRVTLPVSRNEEGA